MMLEPSNDRERTLQGLSALSDGEADGRELRASVEAWRHGEDVRAAWHCYALIGDVLRSDDLAASPDQDAKFLAAFRARLAQEPVVLAPAAMVLPMPAQEKAPPMVAAGGAVVAPRGMRVRRPWAATAAVTASCMVVAGVALVWRSAPAPQGVGAAEMAQAGGAAVPVVALERSPDLDRYLAAHRQFAQGPALAAPGGVRQVALTPEGR